jgi:pimeloyl-ACP methyl ester carboxylesterase
MQKECWKRRLFGAALLLIASSLLAQAGAAEEPSTKQVTLRNGITLHCVEQGGGQPLIFVHGSLSDYTYWQEQVSAFARDHHAIVYSRRYNFPNQNAPISGYSAVTDAEDLAQLIEALNLGKVEIVGHSYGALAALFLAAHHPEIIRALSLAEPPAVSLLQHLSGDKVAIGRATFTDIQSRMVAPMERAFHAGDRTAGVATFMAYVFNDPQAWAKMSPTAKQETLRDAHEWDVMMKDGTLFPPFAPAAVRNIQTPVLLLSGAKSYPFIRLTYDELAQLLPHNEHFVVPDVGHQMWLQAAAICRQKTEDFFRRNNTDK